MILVTGATGFLGKRVCRKLDALNLPYTKTSLSLGLDLRNKEKTLEFFNKVKPTYILNCASFVGGIQFGNKYPVEIFQNNLEITLSILNAAHLTNVKKIVNPISNCAYPAKATLFKEEDFWDGPLHDSVLVYGFVRKAFWIGSQAYTKQYKMDILNIILSNMYGPEDHFEEERSHALGALIMKFVEAKKNNAKQVVVWGTGKPVREWLHVDDGADAMIKGIQVASTSEPINIGVGKGISIYEMASLIKEYVGFEGEMVLDASKPDGAPYKTVDGTKGQNLYQWKPSIDFHEGIKETIEWYNKNGKTK